MKKNYLVLAGLVLAFGLTACSGNDSSSTTTTTTSDSNASTPTTSDTANNMSNNNSASSTMAPAATKTPLNKADSTFVMKAAMGGMMEVEAGKIAQENAQNDRVKAFGSMMVNDHTNANNELMALASGKGMTIPATLPPDKQKHIDAMKTLKGKAFDSHYISMMLDDHKKDVAEFEKQSTGANDADLKSWAAKTLPTLKTHLDSVQALSKAKPM